MSQVRRLREPVATAMLVAAVALMMTTVAITLVALNEPVAVTWGTQGGGFVWSILLLSFPLVGWLIVRRDTRNIIGWIMLWVGVASTLDFAAASYAGVALLPGSTWPLAAEIGNVGNWGWILWIGVIAAFLAPLFPDGRPLSRRWRFILTALAAGIVLAAVTAAMIPGPLDLDPRVDNPFGVESPIVRASESFFLVLPVGAILSVVAVVTRYRRASDIERAQLRWFISALVFVAVTFIAAIVVSEMFHEEGSVRRPLVVGIVQDIANAGWALIGVAIGVAVLRYRLYAIDVVINRALVYGSLTAILAAVYLGAVVAFQAALRPIAGEGEIAVAASTLVVAALFGPLRRRIQSFIDRRFYRARYDAGQLLEAFSARMRRDVDLDGVADELEATVRAAVRPASATVWLRPR